MTSLPEAGNSKPKAVFDWSTRSLVSATEISARQALLERIAGVSRFRKPLEDMQERDANEGDTRLIVTDVLTDVLGYDKFTDLTTEYRVRSDFADYGIRIDQQMVAFVEVKRIGTKLNQKHLRQVETYAANEGVEWAILTNGIEWKVWHLSPGLPVGVDLVMKLNLLDGDVTVAEKLVYLAKESLSRNELLGIWHQVAATAPAKLLGALFSDAVMSSFRGELQRQTGQDIEAKDLIRAIRDGVVSPDLLDGEQN